MMGHFAVVLVSLSSFVSARPDFLSTPLTYDPLETEPQAAFNGGTDRPEDTMGKTQHAAVHDGNVGFANEPPRPALPRLQSLLRQSTFRINNGPPTFPAPLGVDGRVVDTAEVAAAKAAHAAAHANERLNLANEAARSSEADNGDVAASTVANGADGKMRSAAEITAARFDRRKVNLANEVVKSTDGPVRVTVPLVFDNGVVAALVPVGYDGTPVTDDMPRATMRVNQNLPNVKSVDALAVAGPALAYGRLIY